MFATIHFSYSDSSEAWCEIMLRICETIWSLVLYNQHRNCCERCNPPDNCPSNFAYLHSCAQKASICANYACARKLCTSYIRLVHVPYIRCMSFMLEICACLQAPLNRTNASSGARMHSMKLFHRIYDQIIQSSMDEQRSVFTQTAVY